MPKKCPRNTPKHAAREECRFLSHLFNIALVTFIVLLKKQNSNQNLILQPYMSSVKLDNTQLIMCVLVDQQKNKNRVTEFILFKTKYTGQNKAQHSPITENKCI